MASEGQNSSEQKFNGQNEVSSAGAFTPPSSEPSEATAQRPRKPNSSWVDSQKQRGTKRPALTHFLCIPLVNKSSRENIIRSLDQFREDVRISNQTNEGDVSAHGNAIPEKAIRPIGTLHLTLGVMSLGDSERVKEAISFLENLDLAPLLRDAVQVGDANSKAPSDDFRINLKALAAMQNPGQTSILYATPSAVSSSFDFYEFCNKLRTTFISESFLNPDDRPLRLHATIVNTIYAKQGGRQGFSKKKNNHSRGPLLIDAMNLIGQYKNFVWAEDVIIEKIAICKMGAKKIINENGDVIDEEYEEVASRYLPGITA